MITMYARTTIDSLLSAVLLRKILLSTQAQISFEKNTQEGTLKISLDSFSLEHLIQEYERKFHRIEFLHSGDHHWPEFVEIFTSFSNLAEDSHHGYTEVIAFLDSLLIAENPTQILQRKIVQKNLLSYTRKLQPSRLFPLPLRSESRVG